MHSYSHLASPIKTKEPSNLNGNRVLWFNLGMHHIPHTGDLPNTLMTSAHSAIRLEPLNYLPGDASVATAQQVRVVHETGEVKTFGASGATCSVDMGALEVGAITDKGP
jgi:primary-amine oxidase